MPGQIIKRGDNTWLVRIFLGRDTKGKRTYLNKTIHGTKKDAQTFIREKERARDFGLPLESLNITFNEYLDRWLKFSEQHVREYSHFWYKQLLESYVRPTLGTRRLAELQPLDFQSLYDYLLERGLSGRTVRHVHARIVTALNQAVRWRMIQQNHASLIKPPKIVKREMHFLTPEEAARFLVKTEQGQYGTMLRFALATGLRPEEYLGLQWKELELDRTDRGVVHIRRVVHQLSRGGGWMWGDVKSPSSRRDVYFPLTLVHELKKHRIQQQELRLRMGKEYEDHNLVFATKFGTPIHRKFVTTYHFKPTLKRAELPHTIRLYDLRHSYVTLSLISGVKPKVVSQQAGHSSVAFTLDNYAHVIPEEREGASDKLESLLFNTGA
ncbi:MAG TPA: tyrosine-type recombinase/integrase [Pyrinomonadaceae bacterium]|jgi:integrase